MFKPSTILFLLDNETAFVFESYRSEHHFVETMDEWEQMDKSNLEQYKAIVILTELNWSGKSLNEDYGFTIGLALRRIHKCLQPLILCSSMPQSFFEHRSAKELKYNLLYARGTIFLPLIDATEKIVSTIENAEAINFAVLTDMNEMLFNLRGVLTDVLAHRLRLGMELHHFEDLMNEMHSYLTTQQAQAIQWEHHYQHLEQSLSQETAFDNHKKAFLQAIATALPSNEAITTYKETTKRHRLLLVEDDVRFAEKIIENLSVSFLEINYTGNADEAIKILNEDTENTIVGLLCDWRLYANDSKYWQKQGYEILDYAAKHRHVALFGITSLSDTNVHSIRNLLGFEMHLFKKEHFTGDSANIQWQMMADVILQKCDAKVQLISSKPSGANWAKVRDEYIQKRNFDWQAFNLSIDTEADKLYSFYQKAIEGDESRNVFSINEMGLQLKNNLKNMLIIRRVFLGIYFMLNKNNQFLQSIRPISLLGDGEKVDTGLRHHYIDAYSILRKDWWEDIESETDSTLITDTWEKFDQRIKNFRNALCIDISELPHRGLLPEEKAWMIKNNIDFSFLFKYWEEDF